MKMEQLGYLNKLLELVEAEPGNIFSMYTKLLTRMWMTDFVWDPSFISDESRSAAGLALRKEYTSEKFGGKPCSVLEMLIALAIRIENDFTEPEKDEHPEKWFWEMVNNLNLGDMTDDRYDDGIVIDILDAWMTRKFRHNGVGSPFPLMHTMIDQRLVPIWDQLGMYFMERYM